MAGNVPRSSASQPAITDSVAAVSYTDRVMGPARSCVGPRGTIPARETMPCVATMPTRLLYEEGICTEPPVSVPMPMVANQAAIEAPVPFDEPPGECPTL